MTLSQEPPPAPGLRSRPARRWAAGAPRSRAGATGGGGGGHKGHLASAGDTQVSGQLLGPCSGCWWGAELWGQREHRWRPTAPPGLLAAGGGTGQSCARNWVQRAQWVLGQTTRSSSRGGVRATRAAAGGGGGLCGSAELAPGCSGRGWTTLCHCPTAQPPATPKRPQTTVAWGQPRGDPCAGRNSLAPFSRPPCRGCLGTPAGAGTGLEEGSGPALLGGLLHGMAARPCSRVAPLGDGGPAGIVPAGHCGPGAQTAPISPQLPRRAQTGGSRKSP